MKERKGEERREGGREGAEGEREREREREKEKKKKRKKNDSFLLRENKRARAREQFLHCGCSFRSDVSVEEERREVKKKI